MQKIDEDYITNKVISYMENKVNGNWHAEKTVKADLHQHGVDIKLIGGKRNSEYFFIECKGKSYAKSARLDLCQVFRHDFLSKPTVFKFIPISF